MASPVHPFSDYGVALRTLRNGRNWLGIVLFICMVTQFIGFILIRCTEQPYVGMHHELIANSNNGQAGGGPGQARSKFLKIHTKISPLKPGSRRLNIRPSWVTSYKVLVPLTQLLALVTAASQTILIFITLLLILIAPAPGVAYVTGSLNWAVVLLFMVFPWQHIARDFLDSRVLYNFDELLKSVTPYVAGEPVTRFAQFVFYARFLLWPFVTVLIMLLTAERYRAGLRLAIGHPLQSLMQPPQNPALARGAMNLSK